MLLDVIAIFVIVLCQMIFCLFFFFFNDTATTEIYTLSLHDALPISHMFSRSLDMRQTHGDFRHGLDRKSTRLNSSHTVISYAVFCLKKKNTDERPQVKRHQTQNRLRRKVSENGI